MSSILKALKKVEEGRSEPRDADSWSHRFDTGDAIRKQARRSWGVRTASAVFLVLLLAGAGGWWLYTQPSLMSEGVEKISKAASGKGAAPADHSANEQAEPPRTAPDPPREPSERPETLPQPPRPERSAPPVAQSTPSAPVEPKKSVASAKPPIEAEPQEPSPSPPAVSGSVPSEKDLDTSDLRLEAIVWSSKPESRFAVINGNILRVGGSMEGCTVTAIERNSVTVRSGDASGELRFSMD